MDNKRYDPKIENLRKVTGTLPSEQPTKRTVMTEIEDSCEVTLEDSNRNPYKTMFVTATSTWGNNEFEQKWPITSPEGKLEVIKAVLTNNTLPQAREMVHFVFRVKGVPRWLFDIHTRVPFASFMSIGCRDNNKLDADILLHYDQFDENNEEVFKDLKDLYEMVIEGDRGSWQSARTFLPQSYSHSYHFGQNLLSMYNMKYPVKNQDEFYHMSWLYYRVVEAITDRYPLIGLYLSHLTVSSEDLMNPAKKSRLAEIADTRLEDLDEKDLNLLLSE